MDRKNIVSAPFFFTTAVQILGPLCSYFLPPERCFFLPKTGSTQPIICPDVCLFFNLIVGNTHSLLQFHFFMRYS